MAEAFEGVWFAQAAGRSRPCRVVLESGGLLLEPMGGPPVRWPYPALAAEIGGDEHEWIFLSCPDAGSGVARLALRDPLAIPEIAARASGPAHDVLTRFEAERRRHARRRWRGLAAFAIAAAITALGSWLFLTRAAPELVAASVPPATERLLGQAALAELLAGEEEIKAGPAVEAVKAIMDRLTASVADNPYRFDVHVVRSEVVNAAALPGGGIVVFSGLLAEAGSAEEVAGVLAHEIQHVLHRDSLRQMVGQVGGAAVISIAFGRGDLAAIVRQAGAIDRLAYGREQEAVADRDGLALLAAAGLPPAAMPDFFERLERREAGGLPEFLSTHPDTARRIAELRRLAAATPVPAPRPLDIDWAAVRASLE